MPERALGTLGPGEVRTYRFDASFPDGRQRPTMPTPRRRRAWRYHWTVSSGPPAGPGGGARTAARRLNGGGNGGAAAETDVPGGTGPAELRPARLRLEVKLAKKQRFKRRTLRLRVRCSQSCRMVAGGRNHG